MSRLLPICCLLIAPVVVGAGEVELLPAGLQLVAIEATPSAIELRHRFDYVQLRLTGRTDAGATVDVTRMANLSSPSGFASVNRRRMVLAAADGKGQLIFSLSGLSVTVPVEVSGITQPYSVSFVRDVMPMLSKVGCNAGTCHGNKDGQNGFKLSLRGYDPLYDHRALTDDIGARRFNRAAPDQSLMLLKASGSIPHVGGVLCRPGEPYYQLLRAWIQDGVKLDLESQRVERIELLPQDPILPRNGMKQQMVVMATYSDGSKRDVTGEAIIESGDIEMAETDRQGLITLLRRGEAPVLARYEGAYAATTITVMGDRTGFVWQKPSVYNYVDEQVYDKLRRVKILPSDVCTDAEFIRRVYLDLTGALPEVNQVKQFISDPRDSRVKRGDLVDQLVGSGPYVEYWTNKWADMLQVNRKYLGEYGAIALRNWIKAAVATNKPYDQFVHEILTASGSNLDNPPAAYWKILRDPVTAMENTTHLFLATRFNCNKCHDHPFERWTQDQYYHLASYFAQVDRKEDQQFAGKRIGGSNVERALPLVEVVFDTESGDATHDRTGQTADPAFPYDHADLLPADAPRRHQLARWITSPKNPYFARSYVNRLWGYLFGRGIIDPIDDIRAGNPPTNPGLLDALTDDFVANRFDVQHMLRTLCKSRTYQHSIRTNQWNEDDLINYSHAIPRRLPAEVLFDAIHLATGSETRLPGVPAGFRAIELPDAGVKLPFLDDLGRPVRESSCECERSTGMVLGPVMKLVNGPTVADAVADPDNALAALVKQQPDNAIVVEKLFYRFLARPPTETEQTLGLRILKEANGDHARVVAELESYESSLPDKQAAWEKSLQTPIWVILTPDNMEASIDIAFSQQDDGSVLVSGKHGKGTYTITAKTNIAGITGFRLEALPHESLPQGGPGRATDGNFVLSEFRVTAAPQAAPDQSVAVNFSRATADFSQNDSNVVAAIDGNSATGWAISNQINQPHKAVFETATNVGDADGSVLTITMDQQFVDGLHHLGRFRLAVTKSPRPVQVHTLPENIAGILAVATEERTDEQHSELGAYYRTQDQELARHTKAVELSTELNKNPRLIGVQDLAWALINNPAFLFNR